MNKPYSPKSGQGWIEFELFTSTDVNNFSVDIQQSVNNAGRGWNKKHSTLENWTASLL